MADPDAAALEAEWRRLASEHEVLRAEGQRLERTDDIALLRAHTIRLHAHQRNMRVFIEAMERHHRQHGAIGFWKHSLPQRPPEGES